MKIFFGFVILAAFCNVKSQNVQKAFKKITEVLLKQNNHLLSIVVEENSSDKIDLKLILMASEIPHVVSIFKNENSTKTLKLHTSAIVLLDTFSSLK